MKRMGKYKTVMCPACGKVQISSAKKTLRCKYCPKSTKFRKRGSWTMKILYLGDNPLEARRVYKKITNKLQQDREPVAMPSLSDNEELHPDQSTLKLFKSYQKNKREEKKNG